MVKLKTYRVTRQTEVTRTEYVIVRAKDEDEAEKKVRNGQGTIEDTEEDESEPDITEVEHDADAD